MILDNECLQNKPDRSPTEAPLSHAAGAKNEVFPLLKRQAYEWVLDKEYTDQEISALADADACVIGVSWNRDYKLQATLFNDSGVSYQAHLSAVRAGEAYDYFYPANNVGGMRPQGTPVIIAVVDTGVDWQHPDIKSNIWAHSQGYGIDIPSLDTNLVDYNPFDVSEIGHGTHVAGMIGAVANNSMGTIGAMPWRARIMAIKLFKRDSSGELSTTSQYFYNAMQYAYLNGAQVVNLSLGSISTGATSDSLASAGVDEALKRGLVVVTVMGNSEGSANGQEINGTTLSSIPGQYSTQAGVIGVGSFDTMTGQKSYFSHYSKTFGEIAAPGAEQGATGLYSTLPTALNSYGRLAGTSQAAPLVAAAAGMTIGMIRESYGVSPSPAEVERLILASALKSSPLANFFKDGNRLDFLSLAQKIMADYPLTKTSSSANLSSNGCTR
ncbi:MAG: S8 family serine peptidase [Calothrix sp. SM1_5_4]|nr:S8 family serine peptidase [Calothrix sp. SM1_5_4]